MGNAPKLRFEGFTGDWEERKLGDLVIFSKGSGYSKGDLKENGTPIILYGRLYTKYETVITEVDTFVNAKENSVYSKGGEVIVPGSGETAEDISIASVVEKSGVLLGGDLNVITLPDGLDSAFLAISISNGKLHNDMAKMAQGKSIVHLHNSDLAKIDYPYPTYKEQCKISRSISKIDTLITLHQRKHDALLKTKKFFLQNMFPQKEERVPKIRLDGFSGDWEQRRLDELSEVKDSARISNELWSEEGVPYIRASDLSNDFLSGILFLSNDTYEMYKEQTGAPSKGDVLFNGGGEIGKAILKNDDCPVYVQGGAVLYTRTSSSEKLDGAYLKTYFETTEAKKYFDIASTGGTMKHFTLKPAKEMPICFPAIEEQKNIGSFFGDFDTLLTLHRRKCDTLKTIKQFMLQNMFV